MSVIYNKFVEIKNNKITTINTHVGFNYFNNMPHPMVRIFRLCSRITKRFHRKKILYSIDSAMSYYEVERNTTKFSVSIYCVLSLSIHYGDE